MEKLIQALRELITDIDGMRCIPDDSHDDSGHWFGPFSESDATGWDDEEVTVEWPNLSISLQDIKKALQEFEFGG